MKKKSVIFEIVYCILILTLLVGSMLTEIGVFNIPKFLVPLCDRNATLGLMLQIQTTMAVLPMAIIALISGFTNSKLYGIGMINYFFEIKPLVLKTKRIMIMQLLGVLAELYLYSFNLYNVMESILVITIINSLILTEKVFKIFYFSEKLQAEIREYVLSNLTVKNLKNLKEDSEILIAKKDYNMLKDNITILLEGDMIFKQEQKNTLASILENLFQTGDEKSIIFAIEQMSKAYENMTSEDADYVYQLIFRDFFKSLKNIDLLHLYEKNIDPISNLKFYLFKKTNYNNNIKYFSGNIYIHAIVNNRVSDPRSKQIYANKLYENLFPYRTVGEYEISDRLNFKSTVIKYSDKEIVEKHIFNVYDIKQQDTQEEMFIIIIFLYYLSWEKAAVTSELSDYANEIISQKKQTINNMLKYMSRNVFTAEFVDKCYMYIQEWEITPINVVFNVMYEKTVNSFFVMYALTCAKYDPDFNILSNVVKGREFSLYEHYFGSEKSIENTKSEYAFFCDLFGFVNEINEISLLKDYLSDRFKAFSIKSAVKETVSESEKSEIQQILYNYMKDVTKNINSLFQEQKEKIATKNRTVFESIEFVYTLKSGNIESIKENIKAHIIVEVCKIIMDKIKIENLSRSEPIIPYLERFEEAYPKEQYNLLLGYRAWCNYDEEKRFHDWLKEKNELYSKNISDILFCINASEVYLHISEISLDIEEITKEEFESYEIERDGELYQFTITNDLQSKFTEEELYNYICNTRKKIIIKTDISYAFSDAIEYVGYGLVYEN